MKTIRLSIYGRVQGVFYRKSFCQKALELGVLGHVKNKSDGSVEALITGDDGVLAELITWAHRGPPAATVERIEQNELTEKMEFDTFEVVYE